MSEEKEKLIKYIESLEFLPDHKKKHFIFVLENSNFSQKDLAKIAASFQEVAKRSEEIGKNGSLKKQKIGEKYSKTFKDFFKTNKRNLMQNKEEKSRQEELLQLDDLLNKLK
ncbi:hypothetical protein KKC94_03370 [Patescibacteria group bacterium]|nr:hypothetical protein [Patescibacteria group bacterium]